MGNNLSKLAPRCYHGCSTKKEFNCGEYYKIIDRWDNNVDIREFLDNNRCFTSDTAFATFIIAHVTSDYLKGKDDDILQDRLILLLHIRYKVIPRLEGKDVSAGSECTRNFYKYMRDILTNRGRINCIAREIPCDCMEEKRIEAKLMEKVAWCFCCKKEFLKEKLLRCLGCNCVQYCSKDCSITDWATHKEYCRKFGVSSTPTPEPLSSSSFGEPSDLDVDV